MTNLDTLQSLETISEKTPWIIDKASYLLAEKLNSYVVIGIFRQSMLSVDYLRELLFDCTKQVIAEGEYGFTV